MKKTFQLIINPARYPYFARQLKGLMKVIPRGTVHESRDEEHFKSLIKNYVHSCDPYLLIWGGDGTAHMALNSLMKHSSRERRKNMAVGFLRGGSGNGIQDSYEVPKRLRAQVKTYLNSMEQGYTQRVDLLKVRFDGRIRYGQLFGTGLDARILEARNRITRSGKDKAPRTGLIPYIIPIVDIMFRNTRLLPESQIITLGRGRFAFRGTRTNAEFPFTEYTLETRAPMIEVGVRPYYGWYYKICPDVVCNDGLMDAYLFNVSGPGAVAGHLFSLWNGHYHRINKGRAKKGHPLIEHYKIKDMTFLPEENRLFHIDGELYRTDLSLTLAVKHRALKFLVPGSFHAKFHPLHEWEEKIK